MIPQAQPVPLNPTPPSAARLAVDVNETGRMLSLSPKTVRRLIARGELNGIRLGRFVRVTVREIHAFLARKERQGK